MDAQRILDQLDRAVREANQERRHSVQRAWTHLHDTVERIIAGEDVEPRLDLLPADDSHDYCDGKPYPGRSSGS